ncbi:phage tail fiber protein [Enterobacter asburiae]|uniref:SGNH hydrolase-type esterase domain-containing protein n=1 Tax=Enterobacter asburiae TaxID=61645 RepID=A0A7W3C976_ENTAS|nr:phage tail fiber protein [Enterobacter asburiae]MBA7986536.1 hypothetical protein [Enterobacter asburiae]MBA8076630.1 hypothetical protein [Enterobacter asburiae]
MSVPNQTPYIIYNANGLTTVFPFEFYIINVNDIQVSINGATVTSGYSVSGAGNVGGGDVIFITPPANGSVVMLERVVPTYRLTDYQDNGDLLAGTLNKDFDRLWMAIQRSFIYLGLALRRPLFGGPFDAEGYRIANIGAPVNPQDAATRNYVDNIALGRVLRVPESSISLVPPLAQRANKILAFNDAGNPIVVLPESGSASDVLIELAKPTGAGLVGTTSGKTVQQEIDAAKQEIDGINDKINFIPQRCTHAANLLADGSAVIIECYGDSTMWGSIPGATTTQDPKNSPAELQTTLNLLFPGLATVRNKALPGTTLHNLLLGLDGGGGTFESRIAASNALVIYCGHCLNDCNSLQSDEVQYKNDLYEFVKIVRKYNKIPVIVTPTLISPTDDGKEYQQKRMPAFIQAQRDVAAEMNVDLVDNFYYSYKTSRMFKVTDIAGDGVHLTQASYQSAGRNLAIPLLEPHFLSKPGDLSGLATSYWKDTITNARAIFKVDSRFGSVLSGDATAVAQNIYYPIVLDNPTDDTTIAFGGLQGTGGGYGVFTYSGANGDVRFSGVIDFKRSNSQDYDALFIPKLCRLGAGLHVLGIMASTGINSLNFTFGGVTLIPRREVGSGYPDGSGRLQSRLICTGDEIRFSAYFAKDATNQVVFSLRGNLYTDSANALVINNSLGVLTMVAGGVTTNIGTLTQSGFQDCRIILSDDRTISVNVGGFSATSTAMGASLPTCYVSSPGVYSVRKP